MKPLAIDLYCGLGGWTEGLLAEGWDVIGFDNARHIYGDQKYPAQLVLQDVLTLHGSQFCNADLIVASPPCQRYSYMAMPWDRAKREIRWQQWQRKSPFSPGFDLNDLFDACFRIQREACEAAGRHIPMVVENVRGAERWVGPAAWHFGSYYLWGDVPALMPLTFTAQKFNPDGTQHGVGSWFAVADSKRRGDSLKRPGRNFHAYENGLGSSPSFNGGEHETRGVKHGGDWLSGYGGGFGWDHSQMREHSSKSPARKAASAQIAKIPRPLSEWIARVYYPTAHPSASPPEDSTVQRP